MNDATKRIADLEKALDEAIEEIQDWAMYASEYFREKHALTGTLARLRAILAETSTNPYSHDNPGAGK